MKSSGAPLLLVAGAANTLAASNPLAGLGPAPVSDPRFHNWQAPGANDVRSPCPGLNTAANHGFIPHSGRGMTIPILIQGLAQSMNIGPDFSVVIGAVALFSSPSPFGGSFDLNDLDQHNFPIEHDASISRQDAFFGNDYSLNNYSYNQYFNTFGSAPKTSIKSIAAAKDARYHDSLSRNPQFVFGPREFVLSFGENALHAQTMGDPYSGVTRLDFIKYFFSNERFPVELGWQPSTGQVNLNTLGAMVLQFFGATPDALAIGGEVVADSYKDVLIVAAGGSEVLGNLTNGLSGQLGL